MKKLAGVLGLLLGLGLALYFSSLFPLSGVKKPEPAAKPEGSGSRTEGTSPEPSPGARAPESLPTVPKAPQVDFRRPETAPPPGPPAAATSQKGPQEPPPGPLAPPQEYGFLAGRFGSYREARKARERMAKQQLPTFLEQKGGGYEVWVGPFATPEEAESAQRLLKTPGKISSWPQKREPVPK